MRGGLGFVGGARASVHPLANVHAEGAGRSAIRDLRRRRGARERRHRPRHCDRLGHLGLAAEHALPEGIERIAFSEDRLVLVVPRQDELAGRRQIDTSARW